MNLRAGKTVSASVEHPKIFLPWLIHYWLYGFKCWVYLSLFALLYLWSTVKKGGVKGSCKHLLSSFGMTCKCHCFMTVEWYRIQFSCIERIAVMSVAKNRHLPKDARSTSCHSSGFLWTDIRGSSRGLATQLAPVMWSVVCPPSSAKVMSLLWAGAIRNGSGMPQCVTCANFLGH